MYRLVYGGVAHTRQKWTVAHSSRVRWPTFARHETFVCNPVPPPLQTHVRSTCHGHRECSFRVCLAQCNYLSQVTNSISASAFLHFSQLPNNSPPLPKPLLGSANLSHFLSGSLSKYPWFSWTCKSNSVCAAIAVIKIFFFVVKFLLLLLAL